jgi:PTS system galactitol-specific IIA component
MIETQRCVARLAAANAEEAMRALARLLFADGCVAESFERAVLAREKKSPTGLPFPDVGVAMPHADPEHVTRASIAIATLAEPVTFRQMGAPSIAIDVRIVVMPALSSKEQAAAGLGAIVERLQNEARRAAILAATTPDEIAKAMES